MLNIMHHQTTAYHPEANSEVERLQCRLKDALRVCAAAANWAEDLPWVLLGLRSQSREGIGLSPAEAVFGVPLALPNEFLHAQEFSVDQIFNKFSKTLDTTAFSLSSKHNKSCQLPAELLRTPLVLVCRGGIAPLLARPMRDLTLSCTADLAPSPSGLGPGTRSSPPATSNPALTRKLSRAVRNAVADRPALAWWPSQPPPDAAVLLPPSRPHFQTCWFLHLYIRTSHDTVQEPFSHPEQRFLHALDRPPLHHSTAAVSATLAETTSKV
jgi:hypothetical protein